MTRTLNQAEAEARKIHDEWLRLSETWSAIPGASLAMLAVDQKMIGRMAEAFEVERPPPSATMSAYGMAWTRSALDATFGFNAWVMPWVSRDLRAEVLNRSTERFSEATITALRACSPLRLTD
jgi:hypothetical protein